MGALKWECPGAGIPPRPYAYAYGQQPFYRTAVRNMKIIKLQKHQSNYLVNKHRLNERKIFIMLNLNDKMRILTI